jgi:hypothetical protein
MKKILITVGLILVVVLGACQNQLAPNEATANPPLATSTPLPPLEEPLWERSPEKFRTTLGWDLTYTSVLNANHVGRDEWIVKWLGPNYQSPVKGLISTWNRAPIESSILVEFPAPHAGEHTTMWFVRTKTDAYYFEEVERNPPHKTREPLNPQSYDNLFRVMSSWQQAQPVKPEDTPENGIPGYQGFLSFYNRGDSRQMLLTGEDFVICTTKKCDQFKPGRFWQAMQIVPRFKV